MVRGDIVKQAFEIKLLDSQLPSGHYNILAVNNEDELAMNYKLY